MDDTLFGKALGHELRLAILNWLKDPKGNFADQKVGDPLRDGVCVTKLAERAGLAQPTISQHLAILKQAGLVRSKKIGKWAYYSRDPKGFKRLKRWISTEL